MGGRGREELNRCPPPFPCFPKNREYTWKKTQIERKTTQVSFVNIGTSQKSKMFWIKNLRIRAIGLLIKNYQLILVKIKLNRFFHTYNNDRIKQYRMVEYLALTLTKVENPWQSNLLGRSIQSYNSYLVKMSF